LWGLNMAEVRISNLSWGGAGLGRIEGKVIFVPQTLPGEVVQVELLYSKKNYGQGKLIRILEPSPDRIEPACSFYQECGGCQLQHLAMDKQVKEKERLFRQVLDHVLNTKETLVYPTLISPATYGYRHRLRLKTAWKNNRFTLGFFRPKSHDLVPIDHCLLANQEVNEVLGILQEKIPDLKQTQWTPEIELQGFDRPRRRGIVFSSPKKLSRSQQKRITEGLFSDLKLNYLLFHDSSHFPLVGENPLTLEKDSLEFTFPALDTGLGQDIRLTCYPLVFTQANQELNRRLIAQLLSRNLFDERDIILDLYCGLGNFALPVSLKVKKIIGLEGFPLAVANARLNQKINQIFNCTFIQAKVEKGIQRSNLRNLPISMVILDPPRTGAREIIPFLDVWNLKGILYISCDPMTLVRDLAQLVERGWKVKWSQPVDFFPQTFHLESVTFLKKD
jgi:23S rRNA (uracil1939-C5)-methyltransferase